MSRDWLPYPDNLIAHHYFAVDPRIVWEAASPHVPKILDHAKQLRERFDRSEGTSEGEA